MLAKPATKSQPYKLLVNFFQYNNRTRFLLGLDGGCGNLVKFVARYQQHFEFYKAPQLKNPVIILLDNDDGPKSLLNHLNKNHTQKSNYPKSSDDMRKTEFMHIMGNLYVVITPLKGNDYTDMEDFFTKKTLEAKINGKSFSKEGSSSDISYSKYIFATKIVQANKVNVSFHNFKPILKRLSAVIQQN